ncbi:nucleotidyl transferase AbiEii/AbiGii toxin family protein [Porphyromonas levii]|uniref:Nucleotidyl transferase AbiEii/AbiGii toxin family protein n=2 Tax=Porphyromonas levii TaxID=28114 RepID=A0A4Y8WMK2_9PORP|nr:nucleotidyl transferase AbiEii/AbiGii toxin family protein [Porphyromonas levii]MBR8758997.1 hypothetical protein [Porphyromonas levii]MBR8801758.1 hypothetical protein [Porphyromonas levii]TFH93898.1 hypothetical protein E4P47_09770 [Porphyromonas levii]
MMNIEDIKKILGVSVPQDSRFDKYILKEYILLEVLDFLSRNQYFDKLTFIGGTALRVAYNINRFSEDLDFDCKNLSEEEFRSMTDDIVRFLSNIGYEIETKDRFNPNLKAYRRNILFPGLLYSLGLSPHKEERFLLKIEAQDQGIDYETEQQIISKAGFYFPITLPKIGVLCSMKVSAFLGRSKGRDIYDLMFLLGQTRPDISFLSQSNGLSNDRELWCAIDNRLKEIDLEHKMLDFQHLLFRQDNANKLLQFKELTSLELNKVSLNDPQKKSINLSSPQSKRKGRKL